MTLALSLSGAAVVVAVVALFFAPATWERIRRDNSPTTTAKPKPAQSARGVAAHTHSHRAGV